VAVVAGVVYAVTILFGISGDDNDDGGGENNECFFLKYVLVVDNMTSYGEVVLYTPLQCCD
jgi:hypothetical protein